MVNAPSHIATAPANTQQRYDVRQAD
ncbi:MAG: hypothetical protein JWL98_1307, partial [Xanthomonadaceae bacterium]|nr:hypothetical protein [Xanthomonadaceae bacterium]